MTKRIPDINGFYEVKGNPLSLVGVFPYLGRSIGGLDPDRIYYVYRPAEELATPECIDSFKLLPWVDDHTMLGEGGIPAEQKGIHGIIGEDVYFSEGTLYGNIKVFSDTLAALIDGGKKELSCGYRCEYEFTSGEFNGFRYDAIQRNIRGNHLALVQAGRMGKEVAVQDHFSFTFDAKELQMANQSQTPPAGEVSLAEVVAELRELKAFIDKLKPLEKAEHGAELEMDKQANAPEESAAVDACKDKAADKEAAPADTSGMDAEIAGLKAKLAALEKGGVKSVMAEVSKRDALANKLSNHIGSFDHSEMTAAEVAVYGVKKLGIACDSGAELATIQGFLAAAKAPQAVAAMDAKPQSSEIDAYLKGE